MKRARFIVAAAVLAIAIPSGVVATHSDNSNSDGPKHDFAVGGGITSIGTRFGFAAQETPNGETHGHATFNTVDNVINRQGPVTCLRVEGNRVVFEILDSDTDVFFGFLAQDNGEPVAGVPVDRIQGRTPNNCTGALAEPPIQFTLLHGNITIHDGTD